MSIDHQTRVEELLADYRRSREILATMHHELAEISESARSRDHAVTVTVGPQGVLRDVVITDDAYQRYRPAELAATIVDLVSRAARDATERAGDVLATALPTDVDPEAVLRGRADLGIERPASGPAASSGDNGAAEEFEEEGPLVEGSWLQDGTAKRSHP